MTKNKKDKEVIANDEEKKLAENLKIALEEMLPENKAIGDSDSGEGWDDDFPPEVQLSCDIVAKLAFMTEERFEDMVDELGFTTVKQLVRRIEGVDAETSVRMLQAMFLTYGMADMADALDILDACADYDDDVYLLFIGDLFDSDIFDWFSLENMFDDYREKEPDDAHPWKR